MTSLQPPYSAVSPEVERGFPALLPAARHRRDRVFAHEIGAAHGQMTRERVAAFPQDDFRRNALAFQEPRLSRNLELAGLMKRIGARHGRSAGEVAIAWVLRNPAITAAIVGMRSAAQVQGVIGARSFA